MTVFSRLYEIGKVSEKIHSISICFSAPHASSLLGLSVRVAIERVEFPK